jgi:hypothetical protein
MKKEDVTKTELKKAAKELNEQLGLAPPILLDVKVEALEKKVIEAAALIDPDQDEFSDGVWDILEALECAARPGSEDDDETGGVLDEGPTVIEGEAADVLVEEAMDDTLVEDFKAAKKLAELKTLAEEWECFADLDLDKYKGLSGPRELRADMLECLPDDVREQVEPKAAEKPVKEKAEKKDKPAKEKKANKMTRSQALASVLTNMPSKGMKAQEIISKSRQVFEQGNNIQEESDNGAKAQFSINRSILLDMGVLVQEKEEYFLAEGK